MIRRVYLLWHSFVMNELHTIGTLTETENKNYIFKFDEDALKAEEDGCFLPFKYTTEPLFFNKLPAFFDQRMLKSQFNIETFGIKYSPEKEMEILAFGDAIRNHDNFRVVTERTYKVLKEELIDKKRENPVPNKKI